jgi:hypothetical protein
MINQWYLFPQMDRCFPCGIDFHVMDSFADIGRGFTTSEYQSWDHKGGEMVIDTSINTSRILIERLREGQIAEQVRNIY